MYNFCTENAHKFDYQTNKKQTMAKSIHRGEILKGVIHASGYGISKLSKDMKISRSTIYNDFEKEFISNEEIFEYGKMLGHDFSKEIPELGQFSIIKESKEDYISQKQYREKYYELLENHIKLLHELNLIKGEKAPAVYKKAPAKKKK
jgi:lambda repressor-like predicted transcriptional regulator